MVTLGCGQFILLSLSLSPFPHHYLNIAWEKGSTHLSGEWGFIMAEEKMKSVQLYITEELHQMIERTFRHGKMSANVERILRFHLADAGQEHKLRLQELWRALKHFNSDFGEEWELVLPEKEAPPLPPEEKP